MTDFENIVGYTPAEVMNMLDEAWHILKAERRREYYSE